MIPKDRIPRCFGEACINYFARRKHRTRRSFFYPKGRGSFGESLTDAPATSDSFSHGPDQQFAAMRTGEAKRLAEHIPKPLRATIFEGRTRAEERRSKTTTQTGLCVCMYVWSSHIAEY